MTTTTQKPPEKTPEQTLPAVAAPGTVTRQEFGGQQLEVSAETAGTALAAQMRAMVEARFIMALRRPRDWDDVRSKLLRACERPGFAGSATEKVWGAAWYRKPVGEGVEGFSIRFAEEAIRAMGNIDVQTVPVYDDDRKRIVTVTVIDLEGNIAFPTSVTVEKTVERRFLRKGEEALRVRVNSKGEPTYVVPATDDDVFSKTQNLVSKAIRNGALRLLPGDIQAEARARILAIRQGDAAKDPDGFRKQVADGFAQLNILPSNLKELLGHDLALATPAELTDLRELWGALKEGRTTWAEVMEAAGAESGTSETTTAEAPKSGLAGLTDRLRAQAQPKDCKHEKAPPSAVAQLKPGQTLACPDCGEELKNEPPTARTPGEDDGDPDPKAAVQGVVNAANAQVGAAPRRSEPTRPGGRQRTLEER